MTILTIAAFIYYIGCLLFYCRLMGLAGDQSKVGWVDLDIPWRKRLWAYLLSLLSWGGLIGLELYARKYQIPLRWRL